MKRCFLILFAIHLWILPTLAWAAQASLMLSPQEYSVPLGNEFTVSVILDTHGDEINAIEGTIKFPSEELSIVGIDRQDSPISSWTVEPETHNEPGEIAFGGIIPDGLVGKGTKLFTMRFRSFHSGEVRVRISSGAAILSTTGNGTNILTDLRGGTYSITSVENQKEMRTGGPITIRSTSHPDQNAWYNGSKVLFEWSRSPETREIRFSVDQNPEGTPIGSLNPTVEGRQIELTDGVWYGHLSLRDASGWSPIGHHRVQIDTERPLFVSVSEIPRQSSDDPKPLLILDAGDQRSGISHFEISIDGGTLERWVDDGNHRYVLPTLLPGNHVVLVKVFDRAGNALSESISLSVTGLELPRLEQFSQSILAGGDVDIEGVIGDGQTARISITFEDGEPKIEEIAAGPGGKFIHTFVFPQVGAYRIRVQAIDQRGALSEWTPETILRVENRTIVGALGALDAVPGVAISLTFLFVGLGFGFWYGKITAQTQAFSRSFSELSAMQPEYPKGENFQKNEDPFSRLRAYVPILASKTRALIMGILEKKRKVHPPAYVPDEKIFSGEHHSGMGVEPLSLRRPGPERFHQATVLGRKL